jgi:hypothetical protein
MKRNVLVFGLISGLLISVFTVCTMAWCYQKGNSGGSMVMGFSAMILALSLMFVAVKNYRDKYNGGFVSFGKALQIGLLISLIASAMYTISWAIEYHYFMPDWLDKYNAHSIKALKNSGAGPAEIAEKTKEILAMSNLYKNPLYFVFFTFIEIFPVGVIVSLITALILKRSNKAHSTVAAA